MSFTLRGQTVAVGVLFVVLVAGTFVLLLFAMSDLQRSTNAQEQSRDVTSATLAIERVVNQLEVSLQGFATTDNDRLLVTWREARANLSPSIAAVARQVTQEPRARTDLARLASLITAYVTEYGEPVISIARLDARAAQQPVVTREGLARIGVIRSNIARLLADENARASSIAASAKREARRAVDVGVAALVAMIALLVLFGIFLARGVARPIHTVAEGATRVAGGDLSTRLAEKGPVEVRRLTSAFNAMARSLEHGKRALESQNEQLRESERLKSELVSIVSHEVRTPLASILGYSSLLLKRSFSEADAMRYLEIIHGQGERLASLIDDFLDVDRVQAGRLVLKEEPIDLKPILLDEARLIEGETTRHRIEVAVDAAALPVRGDRDRLAQVYGNLVTNAVKYSPDGGSVEITGAALGGTIRVEVRDAGIGIPEEHQARIFTKFFRGDARERGFVGNGLGLAVSREIVEAHGGRIGFTSRPGVGSTFWFELPRDAGDRDGSR